MTDFLFTPPSFLSGAGQALDLGGVYDEYNASPDRGQADRRALMADLLAIGKDMFHVLKQERNP